MTDAKGLQVLIAYLIAAILLVVIFALLRLSRNLLRHLSIPYFFLRTHKWSTAQNSARGLQMSTSSSHHVAILISSLSEFQKGQCIFWLAINAAVLVALGGSARTLEASSIAGFSANLSALNTICVSALLFVTFGLYCLHTAHKRSWYIFVLSLITSILSLITHTMTRFAKADNLVVTPGPIKSCGKIDPRVYCDLANTDTGFAMAWAWIWLPSSLLRLIISGFAGVVDLGLLLDIISHNNPEFAKRLPGWNRLCAFGKVSSRWRPTAVSVIRCLGLCLIELTFLIFLGFQFASLLNIYLAAGKNTWGFGQIIALTIWLPVLLEWVYATTRRHSPRAIEIHAANILAGGLENASDHRMASPYKVVRIDSQTANRDHQSHGRITSVNQSNDDDVSTQLSDLRRRRTDIEHRLPTDHHSPSTPSISADDASVLSRDGDAPLLRRTTTPNPIRMQVLEGDTTHASGTDFAPVSRTNSMVVHGDQRQERFKM